MQAEHYAGTCSTAVTPTSPQICSMDLVKHLANFCVELGKGKGLVARARAKAWQGIEQGLGQGTRQREMRTIGLRIR